MRFNIGHDQRLEQKQVLTQRMIQSMEILQLPLLQLEERIEAELEKNPLLELDSEIENTDEFENSDNSSDNAADSNDDDSTDDNADRDNNLNDNQTEDYNSDDTIETADETANELVPISLTDSSNLSVIDLDNLHIVKMQDDFQTANDFAQTYTDTIDESPIRSQNWLEEQNERRNDAFANIQSPSQTLQEYLTMQLSWFDISDAVRLMIDRIINNLDKNGYFPYETAEFLGTNSSDSELQIFSEAMSIIRKLDPSGVGARNLKECLLLQVDNKSLNCDVIRVLIQSHLEDISNNRLPLIVRTTGFAMERIQEAISELRRLKPRPGAEFSGVAAATIIPDVVVEKNEDGFYTVRLEEGRLPNLRINDQYRSMIKNRNMDKNTRDYIKQHVGSAQGLLDAIEQRRGTLLRVSQAIVDYQIDFFEQGNHAIKPLKMQQIADVVGVHITTVSRACDDKWMMTPQGVFPFKRFFSGIIAASNGGDNVSQDVVRIKLQEIIDEEDKNVPLSDEAIVEKLKEAGIQVARRTIVKYRQLLNIPSSRVRKSW
ncbi:MAG: RNA polymerase factor sigma-54 [Planctomycetaceae bacterium]|jgi:RNA polymerase sigma-54 factor|nr:RNA polymerase factor sigma-54 [Planctomycetaceae bacterium]